jgi:hypothetical protein
LVEIVLPASVEVLGENCFSEWRSLTSITFAPGSPLLKIEEEVLRKARWSERGSSAWYDYW